MKKYWIILILVVITGFSFPVLIIYNAIPHAPKPVLVYLNTNSMKEVINVAADSVMSGPSIKAVYPCEEKNKPGNAIPWADVFICRSYNKADSLSGDTLVVFLDTHTTDDFEVRPDINEYQAGIKPSAKFSKCKVMIPPNQVDSLKHCRYKYGRVYFEGVDDF